MRLYSADKAQSKAIVDKMWESVAEGHVSRDTARRIYVHRSALSGRRVKSGLSSVLGPSFIKSVGAVLAVGALVFVALGFCAMKRANERLIASNSGLVSEREQLTVDVSDLNARLREYIAENNEQEALLDEKNEEIQDYEVYIQELMKTHEEELKEISAAGDGKISELLEMIEELDIFGDLQSRSGNLYAATREIEAATTTLREVLGDTPEVEAVITKLQSEATDITYYRNHYPDYCPVSGRYTSSFGWRNDPITGELKFHKGLDICCPDGTSVYAAGAGTVIDVSYGGTSYGLFVLIDHGNGFQTRYAHLSSILVDVGETVQKAERIAYSGSSGRVTGPHLHFEVLLWGEVKDPRNYIGW